MRLVALLLVAAVLQAAQSVSGNPEALLARVRQNIISTLTQLPRYMCTETVSRRTLSPPAPIDRASCEALNREQEKKGWKVHQTASDRLRLDVAVSGDSEMYSWAGEKKFENNSLAGLVGGGATSTGAFATFLGSIFGGKDAQFKYLGVNRGGLAEFGFAVPRKSSHYSIGTPEQHAIVGYDGSFLIDARTFSLVRLTVRVNDIPASLRICQSITTLVYETMSIRGTAFLLPKSSTFFVTRPSGKEFEVNTSFAGCQEFLGDATLSFGKRKDAIGSDGATPALRQGGFPPGLSFIVALAKPIDPSIAAAGDLITVRLTGPIKKGKALLAPKNSIVAGRIVELEKLYGAHGEGTQSLRIGIKLESIELDGEAHPFAADLMSVEKSRIAYRDAPPRRRDPGKGPDRLIRREDLGTFDQMTSVDDADVGYLLFDDVTDSYVVRAGTEMTGTTR